MLWTMSELDISKVEDAIVKQLGLSSFNAKIAMGTSETNKI